MTSTTRFGLSIICAYPVEDVRESISWPRVLVISFFHQLEEWALKYPVTMEHIGNSSFILLRSKPKFMQKLSNSSRCYLKIWLLFFVIFLMCYAIIINYYFEKKKFPIKRKQGINNCFKPLISSIFTTVASQIKSVQKEKEK